MEDPGTIPIGGTNRGGAQPSSCSPPHFGHVPGSACPPSWPRPLAGNGPGSGTTAAGTSGAGHPLILLKQGTGLTDSCRGFHRVVTQFEPGKGAHYIYLLAINTIPLVLRGLQFDFAASYSSLINIFLFIHSFIYLHFCRFETKNVRQSTAPCCAQKNMHWPTEGECGGRGVIVMCEDGPAARNIQKNPPCQ